ncbi:MAG: hypothetical protein ACFNZS_01525 [Ottowia sp.]
MSIAMPPPLQVGAPRPQSAPLVWETPREESGVEMPRSSVGA